MAQFLAYTPEQAALTAPKTCRTCKVVKSRGDFSPHSRSANARQSTCKSCQNRRAKEYRRRNPDKVRALLRKSRLKRSFGLTPEQYDAMLAAQGGRCAICKSDDPKQAKNRGSFAVDHCHETGKIRGLLCSPCNVGIGNLGEDIPRMLRAIAYIEEHRLG